MDFGDILNQWDSQQKNAKKNEQKKQPQVSHKKANAGFIEAGYTTKEEADRHAAVPVKTAAQQMEEDSKKKINPMELWLRRYGVVDKDKANEQFQQNQKLKSREYIKEMPVDAFIDLHGMTRDEAWPRMEAFTQDCIRRGMKKIMFIHGKGNHSSSSDPVLGELVRLFIEKNVMLGTSGHPNRTQGGTGATWVMIKNART